MNRISDLFFRILEGIMVACLAAMVAMVFGNAVLRKLSDYGVVLFGGGIQVSDELSRILFVWLTFVGAVVVARGNGHLGVETLVGRLGERGRKGAMVVTDMLVLICCAVFFWGTWRQVPIHLGNVAPITGLSMIWVYGVGFLTSLGIGALTLARMARVLTGTLAPGELEQFAGELADDQDQPRGHAE